MMDWLLGINYDDMVKQVGKLILQLILSFILYWIAKAVMKHFITRTFKKMTQHQKMSDARATTLERLLVSVSNYTLAFILIVVLFGIFGLPIGGLIAGAGIVGLAIGFGAQGIVSDVVTGFFVLAEKWVDVGDYVIVAGIDGVVEEVGLRTMQVRGYDGVLHFVPNRNVSNLSNYSRGDMRARVEFGFSDDSDINKAMEVAQAVCDKIAAENETIVEGPTVVGVLAVGSYETTIRIDAYTENMMQWALERQITKEVKDAFDEQGIKLPYERQVNVVKNEA